MKNEHGNTYTELATLFFETRQIIRDNLRGHKPDPNMWLRCETLRYIERSGEPTMLDIAKHLRIKAPSATSLVATLMRDGFIQRVKRGTDKRVVRIALSVKGVRFLATYKKNSAATMQRVFSKLPAKDIEALLRVFRAVRDAHRS